MNAARRTKALKALDLRAQGLTLRQIARRMRCAHSTVSAYLRDIDREPTETTQSLVEEQLVLAVRRFTASDSDLHERHIAAGRELRLLLDTLDRLADRRQRRQTRLTELEAQREAETAAKDQLSAGTEPDTFDYYETWEEEYRRTSLGCEHVQGPVPREPHPYDCYRLDFEQESTVSEPTRTNPNKTEQDLDEFPANHAASDFDDEQFAPVSEQLKPPPKPRKPVGPQYPVSWDNPFGYIPPQDGEIPWVREVFGQPPKHRDRYYN